MTFWPQKQKISLTKVAVRCLELLEERTPRRLRRYRGIGMGMLRRLLHLGYIAVEGFATHEKSACESCPHRAHIAFIDPSQIKWSLTDSGKVALGRHKKRHTEAHPDHTGD